MIFGLETISVIFFVLILLWLIVLTFFLVNSLKHYNSFTKGVTKKTLTSILEKLLSDYKDLGNNVVQIEERLKKQEKESKFKIQKIGVLRFNPFADTGGEQSFIISFLDFENNGLIMTSLQGRSGTRWYVKMVKRGKGVEFDLSREEEEALKKAQLLK